MNDLCQSIVFHCILNIDSMTSMSSQASSSCSFPVFKLQGRGRFVVRNGQVSRTLDIGAGEGGGPRNRCDRPGCLRKRVRETAAEVRPPDDDGRAATQENRTAKWRTGHQPVYPQRALAHAAAALSEAGKPGGPKRSIAAPGGKEYSDRDPVSTCPAFDIRNPVGGSRTSTSRPARLPENCAGLTEFPLMALNLCWIPVMDRRRNPFVPGAGLQPPEMAGRDRLLENATIDLDRILAGRPAKGLILLGLRGGRQDGPAEWCGVSATERRRSRCRCSTRS